MSDYSKDKNIIKEYEENSKSLEPTEKERENLNKATLGYADKFLNSLFDKKAYIKDYKDDGSFASEPIRDSPDDIKALVNFLENNVDTPGLNPASGGHLGYIPGGGIYGAALGDYLAAVMNRYAGVFFASPGAVRLENQLINWAGEDVVGYDKGFGGNLTSGGSIANLIAISTARTAKKLKGKELDKNVIYLSEHAHHSVQKAIRIVGLEECLVRYIPLDDSYKMDPTELQEQINIDINNGLKPFLLIASAGTTDTGAIDPLEELAEISEKFDLWYHIDAAYGGFFLLCDEIKSKMKGVEKADSIVLDPHKGLFLPYGSGIVLVKNVKHLQEANKYDANYMQDTEGFDMELSPAELSPELSKHFRGLRMWLPLKLHGVEVFRQALKEKLSLTRYFYKRIKDLGFEVGEYPDLTVVPFRYNLKDGNSDEFNRMLLKKVHDDGRVFISSTTIDGKFMLRISVLSFRTHLEHIEILLDIMKGSVPEVD